MLHQKKIILQFTTTDHLDIGKFVPPKGEESLEGCGCEKIKVLRHAVNKAPSFTSKSQKSNCDILPCTI